MAKQKNDIEAIDWVVRVGDPAFEDWDAFQAWLESDPGHAPRYQELSADVDEMVGLAATHAKPPITAAAAPIGRRSRPWIGAALAASLAVVVGYFALRDDADPYVIETPAGAMRTVALADGSAVTLGGATRITLDRNDPRVAALDRGQAMFEIRHDAHDAFEVSVGGRTLVDVGTAFDVKRTGDQTRVDVSEGAVDVATAGKPVRLTAGHGLVARDGSVSLTPSRIDIASIGAWRSGSLAYAGATIEEVAGDLSRGLALSVTADRSVATRPFYGSIVLDAIRRDPSRMAVLLDVDARRNGDAWILTAKP